MILGNLRFEKVNKKIKKENIFIFVMLADSKVKKVKYDISDISKVEDIYYYFVEDNKEAINDVFMKDYKEVELLNLYYYDTDGIKYKVIK